MGKTTLNPPPAPEFTFNNYFDGRAFAITQRKDGTRTYYINGDPVSKKSYLDAGGMDVDE